ncbi:MAG: phosphate ABC transporter permease subunit PstC [Thaumarchaeota archaeon]|nr:phosphate ABC transporter permease subunit PstC [Nitrososphaerota archaeon]
MSKQDLNQPQVTQPAPVAGRSQSKIGDAIFKGVAMAAAIAVIGVVVVLAIELFQGSSISLTTFGPSFFSTTTWDPVHNIFGALPFIYGTLVTSAIALVIGVPISIGVALFLSEIMKERRQVADYLGSVVELLAAVPSVVFGLWALFILSPMVRDYIEKPLKTYLGFLPTFQGTPFGLDFLTAGIILSIMIIPTVSAISREVLRSVPNSQREALIALGATKWEMVRHSVLPYARSGLFGAVILGLGRAVGETMAVTMVIGNSPSITASLLHPGYTLASVIANEFTEATSPLYVSALVEIGLTLFFVALAINIIARLLVWRITRFSKVRT